MFSLKLKEFFICIFLCVISSLNASIPISLPTEYTPQAFDVIHYDATIDLRKGMSKQISGVCNIHFVWTQDPKDNNFYFHLRGLGVDSVFYQNNKVQFTLESVDTLDYSYYVLSNLEGKANDTVVVTVYTLGKQQTKGETRLLAGFFFSTLSFLQTAWASTMNMYLQLNIGYPATTIPPTKQLSDSNLSIQRTLKLQQMELSKTLK